MTDVVVTLPTLGQLERRIEKGTAAFLDAGRALREIRDRRLYKATHSSFGDYCVERWGFTRQRAHQLIEAAEVSTTVDISSEREARAIVHPQPESHPPYSDGDRSTHPAPEVPPAPSSLSVAAATPEPFWLCERHPDAPVEWRHEIAYCGRCDRTSLDPRPESPAEEVMPSAAGPAAPEDDTPPAAEPSEPGVAGAPSLIPTPGSATVTIHGASTGTNADAPQVWFPPPNLCTDPAHADLLGLLRDLDRLLLPRDEEDWRAWDLGDQEAEGRALMERVRSLLGDAQTAQDAPEEAPSPDPRIPAIRARLRALGPKQRAAFCRMQNVRAEALDGWVAGLNDGELDTAARELGLVGAETA